MASEEDNTVRILESWDGEKGMRKVGDGPWEPIPGKRPFVLSSFSSPIPEVELPWNEFEKLDSFRALKKALTALCLEVPSAVADDIMSKLCALEYQLSVSKSPAPSAGSPPSDGRVEGGNVPTRPADEECRVIEVGKQFFAALCEVLSFEERHMVYDEGVHCLVLYSALYGKRLMFKPTKKL